jgi:hypothetical protein
LTAALHQAQALGTTDGAVVGYLLTATTQPTTDAPLLPVEIWGHAHYTRPQPTLTQYDTLLTRSSGGAGQEVTV